MLGTDQILDDEFLLRRLHPPEIAPESVVPRSDGGFRATSVRMRLREGEEGLSVTRAVLTSPRQLLNLLLLQNLSPAGWRVCRFTVEEVRSLGLMVRPDPLPEDAGHCLIVGTSEVAYTKKMSSKLAEFTRVLSPQEII